MKTKTISTQKGYRIERMSSTHDSECYVLLNPSGEFIARSIFYNELHELRSKIIDTNERLRNTKSHHPTADIISKYVYALNETHLNRNGQTVYEYRYCSVVLNPALNELVMAGFIPIRTYSSEVYHLFSERLLSEVSFCEGDVYIVQHQSIEELERARVEAEEFYKNN